MNIQIRDALIYISDFGLSPTLCNIVDLQTRVCNPLKLKVPLQPMKMPISSSVKMSGYDLVGMSPKLAVDSDIFPNSSDTNLPGETEYTSSSISLRAPMSLRIRDGVCDDEIGNRAALKVVNGGNLSRIRKPLGKNYPVKGRYDFRYIFVVLLLENTCRNHIFVLYFVLLM